MPDAPSPLGYCADCITIDRKMPPDANAAVTIYDGAAVCAGCANGRHVLSKRSVRDPEPKSVTQW